MLTKDHCEYTAGWQLVPAKGLCGSPGFDIGAPDELEGIMPPGVFEGEGSPSLPIGASAEEAQISDPIAPKTPPIPESLFGLQPARDTCRVDR